jgi:hypothetical protein
LDTSSSWSLHTRISPSSSTSLKTAEYLLSKLGCLNTIQTARDFASDFLIPGTIIGKKVKCNSKEEEVII